jgi:hypothetical protein
MRIVMTFHLFARRRRVLPIPPSFLGVSWSDLPHDVLGVIAFHIDASAWEEEKELRRTLLFLRCDEATWRRKLDSFEEALLQVENVGYESYGHGYGCVRSAIFLRPSLFRVGTLLIRADVGDVVTRSVHDSAVRHNRSYLSCTDSSSLVYLPKGRVTFLTEDTTPGWW